MPNEDQNQPEESFTNPRFQGFKSNADSEDTTGQNSSSQGSNPDWNKSSRTRTRHPWKSPELFLSHSEATEKNQGRLVDEVLEEFNPSDLLTGRVIGDRYKVQNLIGDGSMAVVYEAFDRNTNSKVAVKTLKYKEDSLVARFAREVEIHKKLDHPNIVKAFECVEEPGNLCLFVMELLDGKSLQEILNKEGKIPRFDLFASILAQICNGLEHAHKKGVIHRDLKPENIILAHENGVPTIKILDFGVAKIQEDLQRLTKTGLVLGSPAYMSPEQCVGEKLTEQSDIYSVAVLAFEILTGELPYKASTVIEMMNAHTNPEILPKKIVDIRPDTPAPKILQGIINGCLIYDPKMRYKNINELKQDLHHWWIEAKLNPDESKSPFKFSASTQVETVDKKEEAKPDFGNLSQLVDNQRKVQMETLIEKYDEGKLPSSKKGKSIVKTIAIIFSVIILITGGIYAFSFISKGNDKSNERTSTTTQSVDAEPGADTSITGASGTQTTDTAGSTENSSSKKPKEGKKIIIPTGYE